MKILYHRDTMHWSINHLVDYTADLILHGLKSLFGEEVVDYPKHDHIYNSYDDFNIKKLYGKGFTIGGLLADQPCDRNDILTKIKNHYFDIVVFNKIPWIHPEIRDAVLASYKSTEIVLLDGLDPDTIQDSFLGMGIMFKRELKVNHNLIFPISYSYPHDLIPHKVCPKTKIKATVDPRDRSTYIYDYQQDYYQDYQTSYWAVTMQKQGWDCLRHYEILGNRCMPYFINLQNCPSNICVNLPKNLLIQISSLIDSFEEHDLIAYQTNDLFNELHDSILKHFLKNGTTIAAARYILDCQLKLSC